ncbi:MAG TPA: NTP transferase domain-containing protein [Thermoanaerobaculia bacterium]|nr:NTP transferase domain-containing protein [Thermoanaerobaculia bacterium]
MRIGAVVPVRLGSERLPGKALLPVEGRPVIAHLIDRLASSRHLSRDRVVVCTTRDRSDDALVGVVEGLGARVFRGSRDNVLDRLGAAADVFRFDALVEADGDDPCVDPTYLDRALETLLADESLGIVSVEGLPLGLAGKAIRASALADVRRHCRTEQNDTGFMYYLTRTGLCRHAVIGVESDAHRHETARLTLDYPEDLEFFRALFRELYVPGEVFGVEAIVALLRRRPDLVAINASLTEVFWERTREKAQLEYERDGVVHRIEV